MNGLFGGCGNECGGGFGGDAIIWIILLSCICGGGNGGGCGGGCGCEGGGGLGGGSWIWILLLLCCCGGGGGCGGQIGGCGVC